MTTVASPFFPRVGVVLFLIPIGIECTNRSNDVAVSAMLGERYLYTGPGDLPGFEVYEFMAMRNDHGWMANEGLPRSADVAVPLEE